MDELHSTSRRQRRRMLACLLLSGLVMAPSLGTCGGFETGLHAMDSDDGVVRLGQIAGLDSMGDDALPPPRILRTSPRIIQVSPSASVLSRPAATLRELGREVPEASLTAPRVLKRQPRVLSVRKVEPTPTTRVIIPDHAPTLLSSVARQQLHDHAIVSIRTAQQRLQRGAIFTARKLALDSLRHIASSKDLASGGNQYGRSLAAAMTAIRESRDFATTQGMADVATLKRLVQSHETATLKNTNLDAMSALKATEMYLNAANATLVHAFGDVPAASDALVLLGNVEKKINSSNPMHAGAVALTLHQAASHIGNRNGLAHRELGNTLMQQGMTRHAADAFRKSVALQPVRGNYRNLMEASRRIGDQSTVQICQQILELPEVPSDSPVKQLSQAEFTKTYRPVSHRMPPTQIAAKSSTETPAEGNEAAPQRKSWLSIFKR